MTQFPLTSLVPSALLWLLCHPFPRVIKQLPQFLDSLLNVMPFEGRVSIWVPKFLEKASKFTHWINLGHKANPELIIILAVIVIIIRQGKWNILFSLTSGRYIFLLYMRKSPTKIWTVVIIPRGRISVSLRKM